MSSTNNRKPKSYKADGTPKKRWTSAERAAKGHKPHTRGGKSYNKPYGSGHTDRSGRTFQSWAPRSEDSGERQDRRFDDHGDREHSRYDRDGGRRGGYNRDRGDAEHRDFRGGDSRGHGSHHRNDRDSWSDDRRGSRDEHRSHDDRRQHRSWDREDRQGDFRSGDRSFEDRRGGRSFDRNDRDHGGRSADRRGSWNHDGEDRGSYRGKNRRFHEDRGYRGHRDDERRDDDRRDNGRRNFGERTDRPRQDRRWSERPEQHNSYQPRSERSSDREQEASAGNEDQMEWSAAELTDLDTSTVDHEGGFSALGVPDRIVAALKATGIDAPFRIQIAAIPDAIAGRDVLGRASTGSGKTLAFGVPVLTRLATGERADKRPRALILSPTRELAMQIADVLSPLASSMDMRTILIAGGMSYGPQTKAFRHGVDLVVATPGRLVDLLETGDADLSGIEVVVLDEADHMADLGFMPAVSAILDAVPAEGQRLLFSATLDEAVNKLVKKYLHDPVTHEIDPEKGSVATATHYALQVKPHEKVAVMCEIANRPGHTIVFARTQRGASRMAEQMREAGVMAGALHGGLTQGARARVLKAFKDGKLPVLVATDVAARGIDVDDVTLVLQVDPPMNSKDYLHRSGRTARAGQNGVVVSMVLPHQRRAISRLLRGAGIKPQEAEVRLGGENLAEIAGCAPVSGEPIDQQDFDALVAPRQQKSRNGRRKDSYGGGHGNRGGRGYRGGRGDRDRGGRGGWSGHDDHRGPRHDRSASRDDRQARYGRAGSETW